MPANSTSCVIFKFDIEKGYSLTQECSDFIIPTVDDLIEQAIQNGDQDELSQDVTKYEYQHSGGVFVLY